MSGAKRPKWEPAKWRKCANLVARRVVARSAVTTTRNDLARVVWIAYLQGRADEAATPPTNKS